MHGEYYEGTSLPASLGHGHKTTQTSQPIANKEAMVSVDTLIGDDDDYLKKVDSEKPSSAKSNFLKQLMKKGQSKQAGEKSSSHKAPKPRSNEPLREPRMPSWESMAVYASLK